MKKFIILVAVIFGSNVAQAQFKLAHVKQVQSGKASYSSLYLSNENMSTSVLVYTAPAGKVIQDVDLKPGGGQIAIAESGAVKLLNYSVSGNSVQASAEVVLDPGPGSYNLNYSADGSQLAYRATVNSSAAELRIADLGTNVITKNLLPSSWVSMPSWLGNDRIAYVDRSGSEYVIRVAQVSAGQIVSQVEVFSTAEKEFGAIEHMDSARLSNKLIIQGGCRITANPGCGTINEYVLDLDSSSLDRVVQNSTPSTQAVFSSDDSAIIYRQAASTKNSQSHYIMKKTLGSGVVERLTPKSGDYRHIDAQP